MKNFDKLESVFEKVDNEEASEIIGGVSKGYRQFWGALSDIASALEGTSGRSSYHGMRGRGW